MEVGDKKMLTIEKLMVSRRKRKDEFIDLSIVDILWDNKPAFGFKVGDIVLVTPMITIFSKFISTINGIYKLSPNTAEITVKGFPYLLYSNEIQHLFKEECFKCGSLEPGLPYYKCRAPGYCPATFNLNKEI
jgi:hypothetical protein